MDDITISANCAETLLDTRFIKVFDLQYAPGKHYYNATRRTKENLVAPMSEEKFQALVPDAVTCFIILETKGEEPKLLLSYEYRYPVGRYLLSPTAGLIDEADKAEPVPALSAARREIAEETGITLLEGDSLSLVCPASFSSPGMTDESNALACAVIRRETAPEISRANACGGENFRGALLLTKAEAKAILQAGRDPYGNTYSTYTWMSLLYFISGLWQ